MLLFCEFTAMNWIGNELPFINICLSPRPQLRCRIPPEHIWCFWLVIRRHPAGKFHGWLLELQIWRKRTEIWGYFKDANEDTNVLHANQAIWERCKDCLTLKMGALCSLETSVTVNRQSVKIWVFRMKTSRIELFGCGIWGFESHWLLIWQWVYWHTVW